MTELEHSAAELYDLAFPGEEPAFREALFGTYSPECLRTVCEAGQVVSMLFSLPYPIVTAAGVQNARYLYAVATHPAYRGKGLARRLLSAEAADGTPVFLRPMREELFAFYKKAGMTPFSGFVTLSGSTQAPGGETGALPTTAGIRRLSTAEYRVARREFLTPPFAEPTECFLSLAFTGGGALGAKDRFATLFEREGGHVMFREWLGDKTELPRAAAFLGAGTYTARCYDADGAPFGVGFHLPAGTCFLPALD